LKPIELWTGKQVINCLLRPNRHSKLVVNIELKEKNYGGKNKYMDLADG
jgi:DNA-directed RNA polymerase III subunit RPC1